MKTSPSHKFVKTTSHRQRDTLLRYAPGTQGPYWVGRDRAKPSIFEQVSGEFWLIPNAECTRMVTSIKGIRFPVELEVKDLQTFMFGKAKPALEVIS